MLMVVLLVRAKDATMERPYRLTRATYRGVNGWKITGGPGVFSVSVFFEHECAARRTIAQLRTDPGFRLGLEHFEVTS